MSTLAVVKPVSGQASTVSVNQSAVIEFSFDVNAATFARQGNDLVLSFDSGEQTTLRDFFVAGESGTLPSIQLADGSVLDGAAFLQSLDPDMDLETAAGPGASSAAGSGSGEYQDDAGELLGGVDRLGSLDANYWSGAEALEALEASSSLDMVAGGLPGPDTGGVPGPDAGGNPDPGGVTDPGSGGSQINYVARSVLYMTDTAADSVVRFFLMDANGNPVHGQGTEFASGSPVSQHGFIDTDSITLNPDGSFSFELSASGKSLLDDALAAAGGDHGAVENFYDYITFMYDGREYTMQVVINSDGTYSPADADAELSPGAPLYGEWHSETEGAGQGDRATGDGNDTVWLGKYGDALQGMNLNTGAGNDTVNITGEMKAESGQDNTVNMGSGNNTFAMKGHVWATGETNTVTAGNGVNTVDVDGWVYAVNGGENSIDTGTNRQSHIEISDRVFASVAGSKNTLKSGGDIRLGNDVYSGKGAETTIENNGDLYVAKGVQSYDAAKTTIQTAGDVTVAAGGIISSKSAATNVASGGNIDVRGTAEGISAKYGSETSVAAQGSISVDVRNDNLNADGIYSYDPGSHVTVEAGEGITVSAAVSQQGHAAAAVQHMNGGKIDITAHTGDMAFMAKAEGAGRAIGLMEIMGQEEGHLNVTAAAGNITIRADGVESGIGIHGAANVSAAGDVTITATAKQGENEYVGAHGIANSLTGTTSISGTNITINAENEHGVASGIRTSSQSSVTIKADGHVDIAANSGGIHDAYGIAVSSPNYDKETRNTITAQSVSITADASGSSGGAYAMHAKGTRYDVNQNPEDDFAATNKIISQGDVTLTATGGFGGATGMYAASDSVTYDDGINAVNHISSGGDVTVNAKGKDVTYSRGLDAVYNAVNSIDAVGDVRVESEGWNAIGAAAGGKSTSLNTVTSKGTIAVHAGSEGHVAHDAKGLYAYSGGTNNIEAEGDIAVHARASEVSYAVHANRGVNSLSANGSIELSATVDNNGQAQGVQAEGTSSKNRIEAAGDITVDAIALGTEGDLRGVMASQGQNEIHAAGTVKISAEGGHFGRGVDAWQTGSLNVIKAQNIDISNRNASDAVGVAASFGGRNEILATDALSVTAARTAPFENSGLSTGVWGFDGGENDLKGNSVHITAQYGETTFGVRAGNGTNTIAGNTVAVTAQDAVNNYALYAANDSGPAKNVITGLGGQGVVMTIVAKAGSTGSAVALFAHGGGSVNELKGTSALNGADDITIIGNINSWNDGTNIISTGSGNDTVTITGDMASHNGARNTIDTGAGDDTVKITGSVLGTGNTIDTGEGNDTIILNGYIQPGALSIVMGDGYDVLVLTAPDAATFKGYYEAWLSNLGSGDLTGVDAVHLSFGNSDGTPVNFSDLVWIEQYLPELTLIELSGGNDWLQISSGESDLVLDGGAGNDTLQLFLNGADINDEVETFFGQNTISNFENILLDMSNGSGDTLDIDGLFSNETNLPANSVLYIKGDTLGDRDSITSSMEWTMVSDETISVGGTDYHAWTNEHDQTIYVEIGLQFMA